MSAATDSGLANRAAAGIAPDDIERSIATFTDDERERFVAAAAAIDIANFLHDSGGPATITPTQTPTYNDHARP